jgi:MoaA/NifB/PqqE/SkfB family radical SAM enzyme
MENLTFSPETLYRLPWNLSDNAISWLEPTSQCNLYCDGCYRENRKHSHKTLDEIREELLVFKKNRKTDSVSIAGGEPLMHPDIIEIVKMVKELGWKPVINSNGALLTPDLLHQLKEAGVTGFTFHIDSGQRRKGWNGKNELELNELRYRLAKMLKDEGNISCSFNMTVYPENLKYVPELVKWAQEHIDMVHVMVFILYRAAFRNEYDYYVGKQQVNLDNLFYNKEDSPERSELTAPELVDLIRTVYPDFMPSAFLNGTIKPDSYKWLLTGRIANKHQVFGYVGPKFMEIVQTFKHIFTDSYLAYAEPTIIKRARSYFLLSFMDKGIWKACKNYFKSLTKNPKAFFSRVHYQSIMIIQPVDHLEHGEMNMCDGCPDITIHDNKLVWSCRLEELYKYGEWMRAIPKDEKKTEQSEPINIDVNKVSETIQDK